MRTWAILSFIFLPFSFGFDEIFIEKFESWADQFRIRFQDKKHFYDVLKRWMINDQYIDFVNSNNQPYTLGHNQLPMKKKPIIQLSAAVILLNCFYLIASLAFAIKVEAI